MSAPPGEVTDRLERLAAHAPAPGVDPDRLWRRGRRRQGRRWAAAAACAAVLAGVGAVVASPLAAVGTGARSSWTSTSAALWGTSAVTGESRLLDLPVADGALDLAVLSADGTRLAYWSSTGPAGLADDGSRTATGLTVLDLVTGDEESWDPDAEFGVMAGGLAWAGDVVWFESGELLDHHRNSAVPRVYSWVPGDPTPVDEGAEPFGRDTLSGVVAIDAGGFVIGNGGNVKRLHRVTAGGQVTTIDLVTDGAVSSPVISPDGRRIAGISQPSVNRYDATDRPLLVGELSGDAVELTELSGLQARLVLGWRSPTEVVVGSYDQSYDQVPDRQLLDVIVVDVTTGAAEHLSEVHGAVPRFAADVWAGEIVEAPDAPFLFDPVRFGAAVGVLGLALWAVRRSTRSRRGHP